MWKRVVAAYKWRRILSSSKLNPYTLPRPVEEPGEGDFVVAGCPRTGTSLLAAVVHQPPDVVTVMEPWDGLRLPPADLFRSLREEIETTGRLSRGRLDLEALDGGSVQWQRDGETTFDVEVRDDFKLAVKWPTFWQYLDLLPDTRFLITVRHPVEVIASFERVGGRLARGLDYDVPFNAALNEELTRMTDDVSVRRALLYQTVNSRVLPHLDRDNVLVVRYERWFTEPDRLRAELSAFLEAPLPEIGVGIEKPGPPARREDIETLVRKNVPVARELGYDV